MNKNIQNFTEESKRLYCFIINNKILLKLIHNNIILIKSPFFLIIYKMILTKNLLKTDEITQKLWEQEQGDTLKMLKFNI